MVKNLVYNKKHHWHILNYYRYCCCCCCCFALLAILITSQSWTIPLTDVLINSAVGKHVFFYYHYYSRQNSFKEAFHTVVTLSYSADLWGSEVELLVYLARYKCDFNIECFNGWNVINLLTQHLATTQMHLLHSPSISSFICFARDCLKEGKGVHHHLISFSFTCSENPLLLIQTITRYPLHLVRITNHRVMAVTKNRNSCVIK